MTLCSGFAGESVGVDAIDMCRLHSHVIERLPAKRQDPLIEIVLNNQEAIEFSVITAALKLSYAGLDISIVRQVILRFQAAKLQLQQHAL